MRFNVSAGMVALVWFLCTPALAQIAEASSQENAALLYWRYYTALDESESGDSVIGRVRAEFKADAEWRPSAALSAALEEEWQAIAGIQRAAAIERCDFGIERELGANALMNHLGPMRTLGNVLIAEYRRLLDKGEIREANKSLLAVALMPAQISQDEDVMSSLVAVSVLQLALVEVLRACESGSIDREMAGLLLEAIENLYAGDDPYGFKAAIKRDGPAQIEAALINGVAEGLRKAKEDGASDELIAAKYEDARRAVRAALEPMGDATVEMDARVIELWDAPDAAEKIESIDVSGHRYEEVLTDRVRSFASARRAADEVDALREKAVKALESKAAAEP